MHCKSLCCVRHHDTLDGVVLGGHFLCVGPGDKAL